MNVIVVPTILLLLSHLTQCQFISGKVPPAEFDMPDLNGIHKPETAVQICDEHPLCAGFTYRGLMNTTKVEQKEFDILFFRFVHHISKEDMFSNWVSYLTQKPYAFYDGVFTDEQLAKQYEKLEKPFVFGKGKKKIQKCCRHYLFNYRFF